MKDTGSGFVPLWKQWEAKSEMNGERSTVYNEAGERYKGSWKGNKRHGKGVFFYKSGNRYEGEWKDDRRHGLGTLYILEHEESKLRVSYSGNWVNDKPSGMGVFYNEKGSATTESGRPGSGTGRGGRRTAAGPSTDLGVTCTRGTGRTTRDAAGEP